MANKHPEKDYGNSSDDELAAWAQAGDEIAFGLAVSAAFRFVRQEQVSKARSLISKLKLPPEGFVDPDQEDLEHGGMVFDQLEQHDEAMKWFQLAAEKGSTTAPFFIASIHEQRDEFADALTWYKRGADLGDKESQFMTAKYLAVGAGCSRDLQAGYRYLKMSADQGFPDAIRLLDSYQDGEPTASSEGDQARRAAARQAAARQATMNSPCIIATACLGATSPGVTSLRRLRDDAITSDPIARDFFHVFWSRYYEWSPSVARIAAQDPAVAEHIRWGFLDPWLAWLEFASAVGQRGVADLSDDERRETLERLGARLESWLAELPTLMKGKCPADASKVFEAFERFRASARAIFRKEN